VALDEVRPHAVAALEDVFALELVEQTVPVVLPA
jgi:hypothetical protein